MDIVHSHAVNNEEEGLSRFDGSYDQYFYPGDRGVSPLVGDLVALTTENMKC